MKIEDAQTKVCPFIRDAVKPSENHYYYGSAVHFCYANSCMAWIKTGEDTGYCSLVPSKDIRRVYEE